MQRNTPPYIDTKCKACGEQKKSLFAMPVMKDDKDYFCDACRKKELEIRAKC